jgi:hypothetical protein
MKPNSFDTFALGTIRPARCIRVIVLLTIAMVVVLSPRFAPPVSATEALPASLLAVPTTKLLAIGTFTAKAKPEQWKPILPAEVRDTVRLYLDGKIDQWFLKQDQSGVVFLMNVTDPAEARELLGKLPLGQVGLMEFELTPLGPIAALRVLLADPSK